MTTRFTIAPTLPLDKGHIRFRKLQKALFSFTTPAFVALGAAIGCLFQLGLPGVLASIGVSTALGMAAHWRTFGRRLAVAAIEDLIRESNEIQNVELRRIIQRLREFGYFQYASYLQEVLTLKQGIEGMTHQTESPSISADRMEQLVDDAVISICDEITEVIYLDRQLSSVLVSGKSCALEFLTDERGSRYDRLQRAFSELKSLRQRQSGHQADQDQVARGTLQAVPSRLESSIRALNEENRIAERIANELGDEDDDHEIWAYE